MSDPTVTRPETQAATAFITTVGADRIVRVPEGIPAGATVAVVMVESQPRAASAQADSAEAQQAQEARRKLVQEWRELFERTQSLPQAQPISEEEIRAEIDAYRAGK